MLVAATVTLALQNKFVCSVTGKKLMSKCRALIQENQQLGKQLSQGRIAQLEAEIALQKKYSLELKGLQNGKGYLWFHCTLASVVAFLRDIISSSYYVRYI